MSNCHNTRKTIGIIGAGNLASSLIRGLHQKNPDAWDFYLTDVDTAKAIHLASAYQGIATSLAELVRQADVIILAVKPHNMPELIEQLPVCQLPICPRAEGHQPCSLLITVAAGLSLSFYETRLPDQAVIRALPNTSALVGRSVTGLVRGHHVDDSQGALAEQIFGALGKILWLSDNELNALTAVSGSGPAYFYYLAEAMTQAGQSLGLTYEESSFLAKQTLVGAGRMIEETGEEPAALRAKVTSPNGTTHAAVVSMGRDGFSDLVLRAMTACRNRAEEMEQELTPPPEAPATML
ncbi:MAG: pyrroline-5-carboxylate reductase [Gracilibacteraceae bacterium]|jgi:pyrroline-5-carboxylate reductase|nr:pyrroline-5-carboxylate reductase [Gracilibacteraceae bacterium]